MPTPHFVAQEPPQSTSVSVAFFTPSGHLATWQIPAEQTPLVQSAPTVQPPPSAHLLAGAQLPPQSMPVSVPFLLLSAQVGFWQNVPVQTLLLQSAAPPQVLPPPHFGQLAPPQSISLSVPFFVKSVQAGTAHNEPEQTPLVQSDPTLQDRPLAHLVAQVAEGAKTPPQSSPVSVPFFTESGHRGAWQVLVVVPEQTPEAQSLATLQSLVVPQREQLVEPPQSTSDSPWFFVTSEQLASWQILFKHTPVVQ